MIRKTSKEKSEILQEFQDVLQQIDETNDTRLLRDTRGKSTTQDSNIAPISVVVLTAIPDEVEGVKTAFNITGTASRKYDLMDIYGFAYQLYSLHNYNVAFITQTNMGMAYSSSLTTRAILAFKPEVIVMVGICAGREGKVNIGDVVIPNQVFDYTAGKVYIDRFGPRPHPQPLNAHLATIITNEVLRNNEFKSSITNDWPAETPDSSIAFHFAPIASGTAVIDDKRTIEEIIQRQDDLVGIDMEAYGFAVSATELNTRWLIIKTVQDFADGNKNRAEKAFRKFAAYASPKLLSKMLEAHLL